jgi:dihydroxyacid dehydratase/phosphogluconate dehydratase
VLANVRPSGRYLMEDFHYAGGIRALKDPFSPISMTASLITSVLHPIKVSKASRVWLRSAQSAVA